MVAWRDGIMGPWMDRWGGWLEQWSIRDMEGSRGEGEGEGRKKEGRKNNQERPALFQGIRRSMGGKKSIYNPRHLKILKESTARPGPRESTRAVILAQQNSSSSERGGRGEGKEGRRQCARRKKHPALHPPHRIYTPKLRTSTMSTCPTKIKVGGGVRG